MSELEDRVRNIEGDVKKIMTNDLPHITEKLSSLSANQKWLTTITLIILTAVLAGIIQNAFFK
tara:strand:- start:779 stop:967 length:189 start_codon:yes stop_codon:yes gene_type:complete